MPNSVTQPTVNPTNKLTAATLAAAVMSISGLIVRNLAPEWYDVDVWTNALPIVIFAVGWFVPDKPNVLVVLEDQQGE